jgi:hypothetical protein
MSTPTLKELCAAATPGPWRPLYFGNADWAVYATDNVVVHFVGDVGWQQAEANNKLSARLDPQTVLAVYEALEWGTWSGGGKDPDQFYCAGCSQHNHDCEKIVHKPSCVFARALALLNGETK